jgi:spore maturation protein B
MNSLPELSTAASHVIFLTFLVGIPVYGFLKGVKVFESFVNGAKEGFQVAVRIIPYLVGILVAVGMFRSSGAMEIISSHLPNALAAIGLSPEIITLVVMRPLSGSGSLGILGEILRAYGPDSYQAKLGSVILGSTETTLYVVAVYFGSVAVRDTRYAIHAGLLADAVGVLAAVVICRMFFTS